MPLQKLVIDVPASDGLSQKWDPHSLPSGKSGAAVNLVKSKQGILNKRLGLFPLTMTDPLGSGFSLSAGVKLANWNDDLLAVGRGVWTASGATVTCLQTQSDDLGGMVNRGPMPDVKTTFDKIFCNSTQPVMSICSKATDDYMVFAWISTATYPASPTPFQGVVYWAAIELSTGNFVMPPTVVASAAAAQFLRLTVVGKTWVMCWSDFTGNPGVIQGAHLTEASLAAGGSWIIVGGGIISDSTGANDAFDMQTVTGDTTSFVIARGAGTRGALSVVVERRLAATPNTLTSTWTVKTAIVDKLTAFGVRADSTTTGKILCAFSEFNPGTSYVINAASGHYPAMTSSRTVNNIYTSPGTTTLEDANPPVWLSVTYGGSAGSTGGFLTWTISHSLYGSCWTAWTGIAQSQNFQRFTTATPDQSYDARIISNMVLEGVGGSLQAWANAAGGSGSGETGNAGITPGVILASQGVEANGIAYFLGWTPSLTQGSYIVLAQDLAQNPTITTASVVPMRPVGILQTRTALSDPGAYNSGIGVGDPLAMAPNYWTGGSSWSVATDVYQTASVAYVGGERGARLQPAYGRMQLLPATGYPAAQWGTMTSFGGALPMTFAGQNAVEQNFLYNPESIAAVIGSSVTTNTGPTWTHATDSISWIFCWEWFDEQGNFHQSARSTPIVLTGADVGVSGTPTSFNPTFYVPSLGTTLKQWGVLTNNMFAQSTSKGPSSFPTLGCYRTGVSTGPFASTYFRVNDRYYNDADPGTGIANYPPVTLNTFATTYAGPFEVTFQDFVPEGTPVTLGSSAYAAGLTDGTHPELYDDGTSGAPGSLDNFCPPATNVMVRHKERLFVARGNQLLFTKRRGDLAGPGYNEQVDSIFVGNDDDIMGLASMDGYLVVLKSGEVYAVSGEGPADDGSGSSFSQPQPVPTDIGCLRPEGVIYGPEGVYYMSSAGLRLVSRSLAITYAGGPIETEWATYPTVTDIVFYPQNNRIIFLANVSDTGAPLQGELWVRDYAFDAWTTSVVPLNPDTPIMGFISAAAAIGRGTGGSLPAPYTVSADTCMHFMASNGVIWREHNPLDQFAYFDNATYVSWTWLSPPIYPPGSTQQPATKQGRFRLWDILAEMESDSPHGLVISVAIDNGAPAQNRTWTWNTPGSPSIAPGGTTPTPLTQLRTYDGRMGETFQVQVQDVSDPNSTNGQGAQFLGLTLALGVYQGPYKLPASATQ